MLSRLVLAMLVMGACGLAGCNPSGKLMGKWEADFSGVQAEVAEAGNPLAAMAVSMMSSVRLQSEFQADGRCSVTGSFFGQANTTSGKWRYVKSEGDTLVLMVTMGSSSQERELKKQFAGARTENPIHRQRHV
jgi:hypothetical protein